MYIIHFNQNNSTQRELAYFFWLSKLFRKSNFVDLIRILPIVLANFRTSSNFLMFDVNIFSDFKFKMQDVEINDLRCVWLKFQYYSTLFEDSSSATEIDFNNHVNNCIHTNYSMLDKPHKCVFRLSCKTNGVLFLSLLLLPVYEFKCLYVLTSLRAMSAKQNEAHSAQKNVSVWSFA